MSVPGDRARQDEVIQRLRELHDTADDETRPRAALYLGLAIKDRVLAMADDGPQRRELASDGLRLLLESADRTDSTTGAIALLRTCLPAAEPDPGPDTFTLGGGDLTWDVDWSAMQGSMQETRNLTAMLPVLGSMLPPHDPTRLAFESLAKVMAAFEDGQWTRESDAALQAALGYLDQGELNRSMGHGMALMLRTMALFARSRRCMEVKQQGGEPDWPSAAEVDSLIAELESANDAGMMPVGMGPNLQAMEGIQHLFIAFVLATRIQVSLYGRGVRRDTAWRDELLRLLDKANDHLRQMPPSHAGLVRQMRGQLSHLYSMLSGASLPPSWPDQPAGPAATAPAPRPPAPPAADPAPSPPEAVISPSAVTMPGPRRPPLQEPGPAAGADAASPLDLGLDLTSFTQQLLPGLKLLADGSEASATLQAVGILIPMVDAFTSRRWTAEHDDLVTRLEQLAQRVEADGEPASTQATVTAMLAMVHSFRSMFSSVSQGSRTRRAPGEIAALIAENEAALERLQAADRQPEDVAGLLRAIIAMQLVDQSAVDEQNRARLLARARAQYGQVPQSLVDRLPILGVMSSLEQLMEGVIQPDDEAVTAIVDLDPNRWDVAGGDWRRAMQSLARAQKTMTQEDLGTAIWELQTVWIGLPAGSPMRAGVLIALANMQGKLTMKLSHKPGGADMTGTALAAVRAARQPDEWRGALRLLITAFSIMLSRGERQGPFGEAEDVLRAILAGSPAGDWELRVTLLTAIGAAAAMRALASGEEAQRAAARQVLAEAEGTLPEPEPTGHWLAAARILCSWASVQAICVADGDAAQQASRLIDMIETVLADPVLPAELSEEAAGPGPSGALMSLDGLTGLRQQLREAAERPPREPGTEHGRPGGGTAESAEETLRAARASLDQAAAALGLGSSGEGPARPFAMARRLDLDELRAVAADLHQALSGAISDSRLRQQIDQILGICHAELYWADPAKGTITELREAVAHLNRALMAGDHALPSVEWADMLSFLAQCLWEAARRPDGSDAPRMAERVARAALRELADCVMIADDTGQALELAVRANEIVAQVIGWCLAAGRPRAAVSIAEMGRGLVLASVALSGHAGEILHNAGQPEAAAAWRGGDEAGRAAALAALREITEGSTMLATPTGQEISVGMISTRLDAVVYLVPPAGSGTAGPGTATPGLAELGAASRSGHALLVRPGAAETEVVPLPELADAGPQSPLGMYLAALDGALHASRPELTADGFRGGPAGQAWADALDEVGRWTYTQILGPVLDHVRGWSLDHQPHLALVPIGELAAIPYAAAWTGGPASGERRYAIEDVILSYAASARLLGEVSRRPRLPLAERVVLVNAPGGDLPMTRRATTLLASRQYPRAEVYGRKSARNGPATSEALLGALPAQGRQGASLLQLSTHGTNPAEPALVVTDGELPLARILEQARDRAHDAPGGLVITNACLTDTTRTHYDESLTMATAFLAAGATAVIGTRWPVDDDMVALLSLRLHYQLHQGYHPAEALRRAQLDMLRPTEALRDKLDPVLAAVSDARISHPASWAGHVHHGI